MMDRITEEAVCKESERARRGGVVCPSLILAAKVVCDRGGSMVEPTRARVRDYCTTQLHSRCPYQVPTSTPW